MNIAIETCYIGLGSNLSSDWGDSRKILSQAISQLELLGNIKVSRLYSSPPMGPQDQPDYLNAVVEIKTQLSALDLLDQLQNIENESGRVRLRHWGERTLDLDLLLYGDQQIQHERLVVPHVGLLHRDFVILPLLDVATDETIQKYQLVTLDCIQQPSARIIAEYEWYKSLT